MSLGFKVGRAVRKLDRNFGILAILSGDPRPPLGGFDLDGEKLIDWGWVCSNLPRGSKRALEIGPGKSPIISAMLSQGYEVCAIDASADPTCVIHGFRFVRGDFNEYRFDQKFDVVVACSVVEHLGLAGRYGAKADLDADLKAMRRIRDLLESGGELLLTIPVGVDAIHKPFHRVYGKGRLPLLLDGFKVLRSRFLQKKPGAAWFTTTRESALATPVDVRRYALGEMVLGAQI